MTLHLHYRDETGSYPEIPISLEGYSNFRLTIGYSHPATLSFSVAAAQHTLPLPWLAHVVFYDDTDGAGSFAAPQFEGHIDSIAPVSSLQVDCTAYDPTARAGQEVFVMSGPTLWPTETPRSVYNVAIEQDDDWAWSRNNSATVGDILEDVLADAYARLVQLDAAPPLSIGTPAYDTTDTDALTFKPQEKVVFQGQTIRAAIDQMLAHYPQRKMLFRPGTGSDRRKWRLRDVKAAPQVTLTLNQFADGGKHVLSLDLRPSKQNRYTAVRIYGPPAARVYESAGGTPYLDVSGGGLTERWTALAESNFLAGGPGTSGTELVSRSWQITDSSLRRLHRILPTEVLVPTSKIQSTELVFIRARVPTATFTFDGTTYAPMNGITLDLREGIFTAPAPIYQGDTATGPWTLPLNVRFYFAYLEDAMSVRYPTDGYEGTAFDIAGVENEMVIYDESLATGWEDGTPVLLEDRAAQFLTLAQQLHEAHKDLVWAGGCVLDGIDYDFLELNTRINFAAVDGNGDAITTGWEAINAILMDVEYDYSEQTTTLVFSSDHLEFMLNDVEEIKRQLKIQASHRVYVNRTVMNGGRGGWTYSDESGFVTVTGDPNNPGII